jgi:signal transduction histidine kinase
LGEGLIGQVILTGEPLIVDDYDHWPGRNPAYVNPNPRAVGVPLKWQGKIIGGMSVRNHAKAPPFTPNDAWILSLFADLTTIALKNAELYAEVESLNETLEQKVQERTRELTTAKEEITATSQRLRQLLHRNLCIQEKERTRIARDMHDGVVQLTTAASYELRAASALLELGQSPSAHNKLNGVRDLLREIEKEIRSAIYALYPPALDAVGLVSAVQEHAERFQQASGITCQVRVTGDPCRLSPSLEAALFRVVEQSLDNVACHAQAMVTSVDLRFEPALFHITVEDNGRGFTWPQRGHTDGNRHLGLTGMQERVEGFGGTMTLWSEPGHGTRLDFCIPIQREASDRAQEDRLQRLGAASRSSANQEEASIGSHSSLGSR